LYIVYFIILMLETMINNNHKLYIHYFGNKYWVPKYINLILGSLQKEFDGHYRGVYKYSWILTAHPGDDVTN